MPELSEREKFACGREKPLKKWSQKCSVYVWRLQEMSRTVLPLQASIKMRKIPLSSMKCAHSVFTVVWTALGRGWSWRWSRWPQIFPAMLLALFTACVSRYLITNFFITLIKTGLISYYKYHFLGGKNLWEKFRDLFHRLGLKDKCSTNLLAKPAIGRGVKYMNIFWYVIFGDPNEARDRIGYILNSLKLCG